MSLFLASPAGDDQLLSQTTLQPSGFDSTVHQALMRVECQVSYDEQNISEVLGLVSRN
jgi:hypothetical protein